jgi:NADH:ubiquinone oxidoreductase subunit B-like Fe-S oxidoreductase
VPVDIYVEGCPPRPENLIRAFVLLQERVKRMTMAKTPQLAEPPIRIEASGR